MQVDLLSIRHIKFLSVSNLYLFICQQHVYNSLNNCFYIAIFHSNLANYVFSICCIIRLKIDVTNTCLHCELISNFVYIK